MKHYSFLPTDLVIFTSRQLIDSQENKPNFASFETSGNNAGYVAPCKQENGGCYCLAFLKASDERIASYFYFNET